MNDQLKKEIEFREEVDRFPEFPENIRDQFFDYWSEPNKKGKMRWELEKTWDTKRRLKRWQDNQIKWHGTHNSSTNGNGKVGTSQARIETARNW